MGPTSPRFRSCPPGRGSWALLVLLSGATACSIPPPPAPEPPPVQKIEGEIVVQAWAEPSHLPKGGGDSQLLVRVRKKGGALLPGVQVRFQASQGSLYSQGKVLVTDSRGMTRDRVTTHKTTLIKLDAGGTPYTLRIAVDEASAN